MKIKIAITEFKEIGVNNSDPMYCASGSDSNRCGHIYGIVHPYCGLFMTDLEILDAKPKRCRACLGAEMLADKAGVNK